MVMARLSGPNPSAVAAQLDRDLSKEQLLDIVPTHVVNMHRVRRRSLLGIALADALGTIVLAYVVFAGVRSYRRELAVFRTIGLEHETFAQGGDVAGSTHRHRRCCDRSSSCVVGRRCTLRRHVTDDIGVRRPCRERCSSSYRPQSPSRWRRASSLIAGCVDRMSRAEVLHAE